MDKVSYQNGDAMPTHQTLNHAQDAVLKAFKLQNKSYTADSNSYKIHGAVVSETIDGSDVIVAVTDGSVVFGGEPFEVEAHDLTRANTEYAWLEPYEQPIDAVPTNNSEGVGRSVQIKRTMILVKGSNYPVPGDYMALDAPTKLELLKQKLSGRLMPIGARFEYGGSASDFDATGLGEIDTAAEGLAICNGNNGTPDRRGLTIAAAVNVPGGAGALPDGVVTATNVGDVFGEETHELTVGEMPEHSHEYEKGTYVTADADLSGSSNNNNRGLTTQNTSTTGGGEAHENRQPTVAVLWVQVVG